MHLKWNIEGNSFLDEFIPGIKNIVDGAFEHIPINDCRSSSYIGKILKLTLLAET